MINPHEVIKRIGIVCSLSIVKNAEDDDNYYCFCCNEYHHDIDLRPENYVSVKDLAIALES